VKQLFDKSYGLTDTTISFGGFVESTYLEEAVIQPGSRSELMTNPERQSGDDVFSRLDDYKTPRHFSEYLSWIFPIIPTTNVVSLSAMWKSYQSAAGV